MKVMILAAGLGTRLQPLTDRCPKPLLPLMLHPMLGHLLEQLRRFDVHDVIINLHHQAEQLRQWLGDGSRWDMRFHLSHERDILGTAGALKRVESWVRDEPFVVMNADILMRIDLPAVWRWHCQRHAVVTMVLRPDPAARQFGAVIVDAADRIRCINGRPPLAAQICGQETVFTGVQVVSPQVLDRIPPARCVSTTAETYPALVAAGEPVYGYRYTGYWQDLGTPERYLQAHWDVLDGKLGEQWQHHLPRATQVVWPAAEQPSARPYGGIVPPVVLAPSSEVAPGARVGPYAVLGEGCRVEAGATVQESVLGEGVHIGQGAWVHRCIFAPGVHVPPVSRVEHGVYD